MDIKPIWSHVAFDSAFLNHPYKVFDGFNQYLSTNVVPPIIYENFYFNILINNTAFLNGAKVEKIDIKTGKQVWTSTFDLTNSTKREYPVLSYINSNSQLELICFRDNEDSTWIFPFWARSKLVRRVYDINSGQLVELKIGSNLLFNLGFTYIYPNYSNNSTTPYTYVNCGGQKQDFWTTIHGYNSSLELIIPSFPVLTQYFFSSIPIQKIITSLPHKHKPHAMYLSIHILCALHLLASH